MFIITIYIIYKTTIKDWAYSMYEMKDEFKTNIEIIDNQHEKLFEITNEAYILLTNNFKLDKYDEILDILES